MDKKYKAGDIFEYHGIYFECEETDLLSSCGDCCFLADDISCEQFECAGLRFKLRGEIDGKRHGD